MKIQKFYAKRSKSGVISLEIELRWIIVSIDLPGVTAREVGEALVKLTAGGK